MRATNIRRTQQSVQNLLAGLLAPDGSPAFSVPIHVQEMEVERLIPRPSACPKLQRRLASLGDAKRAATASAAEREVLDRAGAALGYEGGALRLDQAREVLVCALTHGDALPAGPGRPRVSGSPRARRRRRPSIAARRGLRGAGAPRASYR